jgi:hypothetical protein
LIALVIPDGRFGVELVISDIRVLVEQVGGDRGL